MHVCAAQYRLSYKVDLAGWAGMYLQAAAGAFSRPTAAAVDGAWTAWWRHQQPLCERARVYGDLSRSDIAHKPCMALAVAAGALAVLLLVCGFQVERCAVLRATRCLLGGLSSCLYIGSLGRWVR